MKNYVVPRIEIIEFDNEDIIVTSGEDGIGGPTEGLNIPKDEASRIPVSGSNTIEES